MIAHQGNDRVIQLLEIMLARAKEGRAGYLIAIMVAAGENPFGGYCGSSLLEPDCMRGLESMAGQMNSGALNRTMPPRDTNIPADCVCYNVPGGPLSFDFLTWLVDAEMTRRREGAPAPLKVCFWYGQDGQSGLEDDRRQGLMANVVRPALKLIGAVEDSTVTYGRAKEMFTTKDIAAAVRAGESVPKLRPSLDAMRTVARWLKADECDYRAYPVTITLRESEQYPYRNSNLNAWLCFATYLQQRDERVVIVRDTAKAKIPIMGFETYPEAAINLDIRCALYDRAKINMFVSNGPATLAYFSSRPWMMMLHLEPDGHPYTPNTPKFWQEQFGVEPGGQFPWSLPDQRIIWAKDTYENLVAAWNGREELLRLEGSRTKVRDNAAA